MQNWQIKSVGGGGISSHNIFDEIISLENLFLAWDEFKRGKRKKPDVQKFEFNLEENIFNLHQELLNGTYRHSNYTSFLVKDPKLRKIHKACVKDRVLQHAVFRALCPIFDKSFIFDSYSCRVKKGTHKAILRTQEFFRKVSKNNHKTCYALKLDIRKFFDSVDQNILINLIVRKIEDSNRLFLIEEIVNSFSTAIGKGLPLGNVTSQLFANIYLNELDYYIKKDLKIKYYVRYSDDFVILNENKEYLEKLITPISRFLSEKLNLILHPNKIILRKYYQGIDFLGYVISPNHTILRTKTKNRIVKNISENLLMTRKGLIKVTHFNQSLKSYWGVLKHCKSYKVKKEIIKIIKG